MEMTAAQLDQALQHETAYREAMADVAKNNIGWIRIRRVYDDPKDFPPIGRSRIVTDHFDMNKAFNGTPPLMLS